MDKGQLMANFATYNRDGISARTVRNALDRGERQPKGAWRPVCTVVFRAGRLATGGFTSSQKPSATAGWVLSSPRGYLTFGGGGIASP